MPRKEVIKRARRAARQGKSPSTQASEFVHDEIKKIRRGEHGARSAKQAIAIGLSEARRAGVKLPPQPGAKKKRILSSKRIQKKPSVKRSRAILKALRRESKSSVSHKELSKQAKQSAVKRGPTKRHQAAMKAVRTKGPLKLKEAAQKAAHSRELHAR